jgi:1,4-dihydroxy-2-naphthoyl-CoA hydrolase
MSKPSVAHQIRDSMPFAKLIGVELTQASPELVQGKLTWEPDRCTLGGLMHGGALMALADSCGGVCAFLNLPPGATATGTIESKTNMLRSVRNGTVIASARPLHIGRTVAIIETEIRNEEGSLAAKTIQTQTFHYPR